MPEDWKVTWKKEDSGNYTSDSFTVIAGKVAEQLILSTLSRHSKDKEIIRTSQHSFTKRKSCSANWVNFCYEMTGLVDEVKAVGNCISVPFISGTVSHKILLEKC